MAVRDGSNPDPMAQENRRYYEGQKIYLRNCKPEARATVIVDNSPNEKPKLVQAPAGHVARKGPQ